MSRLRDQLRKVIPAPALETIRRIRAAIATRRDARSSREEVFTRIYRNREWGGVKGEFCSGDGSTQEAVVGPYVAAVLRVVRDNQLENSRFVDLGCGDFRVGRQLVGECASYLGVDVVRALIERNNRHSSSDTVAFECADIVTSPLPPGDVCFVRQVLQHLDNTEISAILRKLEQFKLVFVTEHYPADADLQTRNLDKVHGGSIRLDRGSGVYLDAPPFNLPSQAISDLLAVPGATGDRNGKAYGVIRTFVLKPPFGLGL